VSFDRASRLQRSLRRFAASGPGSWCFARVLHRVDRPVHRLTGGRRTFTSALAGLPVIMLTTTGARSGRPRTLPLVGLPDGDSMAVIASNFGQTHHPAWSHNLRAHPDATMTVFGRDIAVRASVADGEDRARIWAEGLRVYPGFALYERRAWNRRIVVWRLEPAGTPDPAQTFSF
jgi:deazaflavin-dependent oxidoreductase (nitroreductase family)